MKEFNASDLSKKPSELFKAARDEGAIIQHKDRQGNVVEEFVIVGYIRDDPAAMIFDLEPLLSDKYSPIRLELKNDDDWH